MELSWTVEIEGETLSFPTRQALLDHLGELLEDVLAQSPLADAEVRDPFGNELEVEVGVRLAEIEEG